MFFSFTATYLMNRSGRSKIKLWRNIPTLPVLLASSLHYLHYSHSLKLPWGWLQLCIPILNGRDVSYPWNEGKIFYKLPIRSAPNGPWVKKLIIYFFFLFWQVLGESLLLFVTILTMQFIWTGILVNWPSNARDNKVREN